MCRRDGVIDNLARNGYVVIVTDEWRQPCLYAILNPNKTLEYLHHIRFIYTVACTDYDCIKTDGDNLDSSGAFWFEPDAPPEPDGIPSGFISLIAGMITCTFVPSPAMLL